MFILLVCNAGMSTSLVVSKMRKAAEQQGKAHRILATAVDNAFEYYDEADVILLGPQISGYLAQVKAESGKPTAVIERKAYGQCKGEQVLADAEQLYEENVK